MPSRHFAKCLENRAPPMRSPSPPPRAAHFTRRPPKIRPSIQPPHGKPRNASRWGWCGSRLVWCVRWWFSVVGGLGRGLRGGCVVLPVCVGGCVGLRGFLRVKKSALSYKAWRQSRRNQLLAPVIPKTGRPVFGIICPVFDNIPQGVDDEGFGWVRSRRV